jgi:hypothetical protein
MTEPEKNEHQILHELMVENQQLLKENNELLKKSLRRSTWAFIIRVILLLLFLGVPFALYYYFIEPYFHSVGESFSSLNQSLSVIPGWNQFVDAITLGQAGRE